MKKFLFALCLSSIISISFSYAAEIPTGSWATVAKGEQAITVDKGNEERLD